MEGGNIRRLMDEVCKCKVKIAVEFLHSLQGVVKIQYTCQHTCSQEELGFKIEVNSNADIHNGADNDTQWQTSLF